MNINKRDLLKSTFGTILSLDFLAISQVMAQDYSDKSADSNKILFSNSPADEWVEAYPIGNGRIGAMIFGGIANERIQINEDTLFNGGPYLPINPKSKEALPKVRQAILDGNYKEAENIANDGLLAIPSSQASYQPACDLIINFTDRDQVKNYKRILNLENGINTSEFEYLVWERNVKVQSETFVSNEFDAIFHHIESNANSINCEIALTSPQYSSLNIEGNDTLILSGKNRNHGNIKGAIKFEIIAKIIVENGNLEASGTSILVRNAKSLKIIISAATSFKNYQDTSLDPSLKNKNIIGKMLGAQFKDIKDTHIKTAKDRFNRLSLSINSGEYNNIQTKERIDNFEKNLDPNLCVLYLNYARYLLASSSMPGTQPANLQGIWNDKTNPPWGSKWTININTEMNYWLSGIGNLIECAEPLFNMVEDLSKTGAIVAKEVYGAKGWVAFHNTDLWRVATPCDGAQYSLWPMGGAWLLQNLWDIYEFTQDTAKLKRIYPLLKSSCEFYFDTLIKHPKLGYSVTCPSMSPENNHQYNTSLCAGPTMDNQILRDLFTRTAIAAKILETDAKFANKCLAKAKQLPPNQIGKGGYLMEWLDDWDMQAPEINHRHVSHLYGLYPSEQITTNATPIIAEAAKKSLLIRGDNATGWGLGWRINLWARLKDGNHAHNVLAYLLNPLRTYPNMFDAHPPFQIDGNFGGASGILEMLLQSHSKRIELLPAVPDHWKSGKLTGILARGGFEIDFEWNNSKPKKAIVKSIGGTKGTIGFNNKWQNFTLAKGEKKQFIF